MTDVEIKFDNPGQTVCTALTTSSTTITCETEAFDPTLTSSATYGMDLVLNGFRISAPGGFSTRSSVVSAVSLNPPSASPVLKSKIKIMLESDFPESLNTNDFKVNATSLTNSSYIR